MNVAKRVSRWLIATLVGWRPLRERLAFEIAQHHFGSLNVRIPLSEGLMLPATSQEAWISFSEIFLQGEYDGLWDCMPAPDRWLDLGCHAGYFSLLCEMQRRREGRTFAAKALLVDADSRSALAVGRLIAMNKLEGDMLFKLGAVGPDQDTVEFMERSFMSSGVAGLDKSEGTAASVSVVTPRMIVEQFPPPYDLIKVDIEGSEYGFIERYREIWENARYLVLECHAMDTVAPTWEEGAAWVAQQTQFVRLETPGAPDCDRVRGAGLAFFRNPAM